MRVPRATVTQCTQCITHNCTRKQELEAALTSLEASPLVKGLIITSGLQRDVFTAGVYPCEFVYVCVCAFVCVCVCSFNAS